MTGIKYEQRTDEMLKGAKRFSDISIRFKILIVVIISILIPVVLSTYTSRHIVLQKISDEWESRLSNGLDSARYYFEDYQQKAKDNASILSSFSELRKYTMEGNNLSASQFLVQLTSELGLDFVMIADENKKLISRTDQPLKSGDDLSDDFMVKSGLAGFKAVLIQPTQNAICIQSAAPMKSDIVATGVKTIGTVITQYNLDKRFLEHIKRLNELEATLYLKDNIVSTFLDDKADDYNEVKNSLQIDKNIEEYLLNDQKVRFESRQIRNKDYYLAYGTLLNTKGEVAGLLSVAVPQDNIVKAKSDMNLYFGIIISLGLIIGLAAAIFISGKIVKPVKVLVNDTRLVANGDLNYMSSIKSNDEIGQLSEEFNNMAVSLKSLVKQIINTVNTTASSSAMLSQYIDEVRNISESIEITSEDIKSGSKEQSSYLEEAKGELDDVLHSAVEISDQTVEILDYTNKARKIVEQEAATLRALNENMNFTKDTILNMEARVGSFGTNLEQIKGATDLITSIAAKTKLLALNAAIEAARAGDAGRGFGVVAAEIRQLSDESQNSVKSIEAVVQDLFLEMKATAEVAEESVEQFESSNDIVIKTENSFIKIVESINRINDMIGEISRKSELQALNTDRISAYMNDINAISKKSYDQSQTLYEGSVSQTKGLVNVSEELDDLLKSIEDSHVAVKKFKI